MSLSILIVDDDPDACDLLRKLLQARGYQADTAYDGPSAVESAQERQYTLAIIDYQMPGMNGVELFRRLHAMQPDMTGVFLTAHTTIDVIFPAMCEGIYRILSKPIDLDELDLIINQKAGVV